MNPLVKRSMSIAVLTIMLIPIILACSSSSETEKLLSEGNKFGDSENWVEAIAMYNRALLIDPENDAAYHKRGYAYFKLGDYSRAIEDLTEAIRIDPKERGYWANRGLVYVLIGMDEKGQIDLERAAELGEPRFRLERAVEDLKKDR